MAPALLQAAALALRASSIVCPTTPTCPQDDKCLYTANGVTLQVSCATDFLGGDSQVAQASTLATCMRICATTTKCVAVSYVDRNCYMKSTLNPARANINVIGAAVTVQESTVPVAPPATSSACPATYTCPENNGCTIQGANSRTFALSCETDYYGGDFADMGVASLEACTQACAANSRCLAASFVGGKGAGTCYLKSTKNVARLNDNVDAVYVVTTSAVPSSSVTSSASASGASSSTTSSPSVSPSVSSTTVSSSTLVSSSTSTSSSPITTLINPETPTSSTPSSTSSAPMCSSTLAFTAPPGSICFTVTGHGTPEIEGKKLSVQDRFASPVFEYPGYTPATFTVDSNGYATIVSAANIGRTMMGSRADAFMEFYPDNEANRVKSKAICSLDDATKTFNCCLRGVCGLYTTTITELPVWQQMVMFGSMEDWTLLISMTYHVVPCPTGC